MVTPHSLKIRLKLILCLLTQSTNVWTNELTSTLEGIGLQYAFSRSNLNPIDFITKVFRNRKIQKIKSLDYSKITSHDFLRGITSVDLGWSSEPEVARFIGDLVYNLSPKTVIETGCFVGFGSAHLANALCKIDPEKNLYLIDNSKRFLNIAKQNLDLLSLNKISTHFLQGKTWDSKVLSSIPNTVDFIFFDSDHSYEGIKREFEIYLSKLSQHGVAVVHDSILWPGVRRAVFELPDIYDKLTFSTSRGNGMTVIMHVERNNYY